MCETACTEVAFLLHLHVVLPRSSLEATAASYSDLNTPPSLGSPLPFFMAISSLMSVFRRKLLSLLLMVVHEDEHGDVVALTECPMQGLVQGMRSGIGCIG
jgi:hypothetical protein